MPMLSQLLREHVCGSLWVMPRILLILVWPDSIFTLFYRNFLHHFIVMPLRCGRKLIMKTMFVITDGTPVRQKQFREKEMDRLTDKKWLVLGCIVLLQGCLDSQPNIVVTAENGLNTAQATGNTADNNGDIADSSNNDSVNEALTQAINLSSNGMGLDWLKLPQSNDFQRIPQDPLNPITAEKVQLGKLLFHDTALATIGQSGERHSWSCASCHHAAAGFKSGVRQGIGEGGTGFGVDGSDRVLAAGFDAHAPAKAANKPDIQPFASPTILNSAYQNVMLWNGQFGHAIGDPVNTGLSTDTLMTPGTPKAENVRRLPGLEIQAIAGLGVHRLNVENNSVLQTNDEYRQLFQAAYPGGASDVKQAAANAIAAYERTVLANQAPFQRWLNGETTALTDAEKRGGALFFGKANCADCHRGPALSSEHGASENDMFMAIGFKDFDSGAQAGVHGPISDADKAGRGGFTGEAEDEFKFKVPQLYNLADTNVFGHGASFSSIRAVLEYKNQAVSENPECASSLDYRLTPLNLSERELDDLEQFLTTALHDPALERYQPQQVPSGECIIVDPKTVNTFGLCQ